MRRRASQQSLRRQGLEIVRIINSIAWNRGFEMRFIQDSRDEGLFGEAGILPAQRGIGRIDQEAHREKPTLTCATIP
jgi:hypothetical protein